ncbi:MAG: hypothetical protein Q4D65_07145 [Peptostreptococcaceae bacterium]|nr:hypothetical protein [Peptostreptococcaceae bacterium]
MITPQEQERFIEDIRHQGVVSFWGYEKRLLKMGKATRDWTPEQMEDIYNIGESGYEQLDAKPPFARDERRNIIYGTESFYARRMMNINAEPYFAGDFRAFQALRYCEFYNGITR